MSLGENRLYRLMVGQPPVGGPMVGSSPPIADSDSPGNWRVFLVDISVNVEYLNTMEQKSDGRLGFERRKALADMLKLADKYFPAISRRIQDELMMENHSCECRTIYGRSRLMRKRIIAESRKGS